MPWASPSRSSLPALEQSLPTAAAERCRGRARPHGARARAARRARPAARAGHRAATAHRLGPPRRGGPRRAAAADRAGRDQGGRGARRGPRDAGGRVRPGPARAAVAIGAWRPGAGGAAGADPVRPRERRRSGLRSAERALALLGKVNPLALEEFAALEERHQFLTEQLEDLKKTKRDLLDIVREVDERIEQVFTAAYQDVAREFVDVFARLFPGGEGRLVLTDASDMLNTGIEVEARPPGKKVKRLSLLSGGERSLAAVALLVAMFKARPSPFYVMDEVEAALDDTNLGRCWRSDEELRENSQLHRHHPPEAHDGGRRRAVRHHACAATASSAVISQRLREEQSA